MKVGIDIMGDTLTLSEKQEEKARKIIKTIDLESEPSDFISLWEPTPEKRQELEWKDEGTRYVRVDNIVGTEPFNTNRLVPGRLEDILRKMIEGKFEKEHSLPPVLSKVDGKYYVDADGNHRVLAHKMLGIEKIYAEIIEFNQPS